MFDSIAAADHARASRLAALAVCAVAALICLWLIVRLVWLLVPQGDFASTPVPTAGVPASTAPVQSVAKWHLFGNNRAIALLRTNDAPATLLKLTLRGTLAMDDAHDGIAMIADEHGSERAYKVGEVVVDNAKLAEVFTDRVVLDHAGVAETLKLPQAPLPTPAAAGNKPAAASAGTPRASSIPPSFAPPQLGSGVDWSAARKNLQLDPAQLAKQVRVEPVFVGGKIAGARLSGGGEIGALMAQAGLKPTDLVTAVNGQSLASVSNPQQLMDNLKNAGSLSVTVLRDGKPATLTLNLR